MDTVKIIDRSEMVSTLKRKLKMDASKTAIVAVDMHRGHLDPSVATLPVPPQECKRVILHAKNLFDFARSRNIPIIHVIITQRKIPGIGAETMKVKFWKALQEIADEENRFTPGRKSTGADHNLEGSPGAQVVPDLLGPGDYVIDNKRRFDCFYGTDLEILLRTLGIETVVLSGVNTNTCVLNTAFSAFNRDFLVVVISDCVASMFGDDLHIFGLENIKRCMGYVLTVDEFKEKIG